MERKYRLDTIENQSFLKEMTGSLLAFGRKFPSPGGGSYYLGHDGTPWTDRPRETWITSRMAHVYCLGHLLGISGCARLADDALKGLNGELRDREHGGWYAGVDQTGNPLPGKQCYAHAFVILAASTAVLANRPGAKALLQEALEVYDQRFWQEGEGLSCDLWDTAFQRMDDYRGLNANMHTVEAFLAAADVLGAEEYRCRAGRIITRVLGWARENDWRIPEHFSKDWIPDLNCNQAHPHDPFKPYGATPGHGLEWARLVTQYALSADKRELIASAENLYHRALSDGWHRDGAPGLIYTTDWHGVPVVHDRMHWTLAEAINAAAVLYRATGKADYAADYAMLLEYLDKAVLDRETGSWFHQLDRENRVAGTVWPGKPDLYHAIQASLIPYGPAHLSVAPGVACVSAD